MIDRWDVVGLAGFGIVTAGIGLIHIPAAVIFSGLVLIAVGALYPILRGK
jgi:hypothetical protein